MKKRCLLLFAQSSVEKGLADPARLCKLLTHKNKLDAVWAYLDDLVYGLSTESGPSLYDTRNHCHIRDYDSVYFRYWAVQEGHANAAARICKLLQVPFIDDETIRAGSRNKMSQYVCMFEAGIAIPRTLMSTPQLLQSHYKDAGFTFPFIMKDKSGTRGQSNFLVRSAAMLEELTHKYSDRTFILQEYIPNDGDFRVLVVGGQAKLAIHRQAKAGSHLNNLSQGGQAKIVPLETLSPEMISMSEQAAAIFGRDVAGVDIVQSLSNKSYYCFEVNRAPQIENSSFEDIKASLLSDYLLSL